MCLRLTLSILFSHTNSLHVLFHCAHKSPLCSSTLPCQIHTQHPSIDVHGSYGSSLSKGTFTFQALPPPLLPFIFTNIQLVFPQFLSFRTDGLDHSSSEWNLDESPVDFRGQRNETNIYEHSSPACCHAASCVCLQ